MTTPSPLFRLLTPLLQTVRKSPFTTLLPRSTCNSKSTLLQPTSRTFTTSQTLLARNDKRVQTDPRITLIRYHLQHPKTPRPLRLSRLRALRHWTIHRAWMLNRRKAKEAAEAELYRMYQSMGSACEALRNLDPPGKKDAGRLYRIAMEKKGIFGHGGVPIEYARHQVDTPAVEAWNHGWTR